MVSLSRSRIFGAAALMGSAIVLASPRPAAAWEAGGAPCDSHLSSELRSDQTKAPMGDADAQYRLGEKYAHGQCLAKDDVQAVRWFAKAAEQGHAGAQFELGEAYDEGWGGVEQDGDKREAWYRKAADQGHARAQYALGEINQMKYKFGEPGVERDAAPARAVAWYRKAAGQGLAEAQYRLGEAYENGLGVAKDDAQAVAWYRKAADQGNTDARQALDALRGTGRDGAQKGK